MKNFTFFFVLVLIPSVLFAQEDDPLKYFPYKTGDMWEYIFYGPQYPKTLQNFNIKDSIDADGNIYLWQSARFINPIAPPALLGDTSIYKIDTSYNVVCLNCLFENRFHYRLNANQGEQWVVHIYQDSSNIYGYEMVRLRKVWNGELFGKQTTFKSYMYYYAPDSTDTLGLVRYGITLAYGFGLYHMGGGDVFDGIKLKGCVINGTLYGDTTQITSVRDLSENTPKDFELYPNYPNPFNPSTSISFKINNSQTISLVIYDLMGKEVKRLIDNEFHYSGSYKTNWNGKNTSNQSVASGVYFFRLIGDGIIITRSMALMK